MRARRRWSKRGRTSRRVRPPSTASSCTAMKWRARRTSTCDRRTSCLHPPRTLSAVCGDAGKSEVRSLKSDPKRGGLGTARLFLRIMLTMSAIDPIGEFEHVVLLAILRLGEEAYAVSVRDEILRCTGRDVSRGSIYITLDRLETKGYLKSYLADPTPERGGRSKRFYALRPLAVNALKESRRALVALWRGLESVLA